MCLMEVSIMDQKKEFILPWITEQSSFSKLCRDFKIVRSTGYDYVARFKKWITTIRNMWGFPEHLKGRKDIKEVIRNKDGKTTGAKFKGNKTVTPT